MLIYFDSSQLDPITQPANQWLSIMLPAHTEDLEDVAAEIEERLNGHEEAWGTGGINVKEIVERRMQMKRDKRREEAEVSDSDSDADNESGTQIRSAPCALCHACAKTCWEPQTQEGIHTQSCRRCTRKEVICYRVGDSASKTDPQFILQQLVHHAKAQRELLESTTILADVADDTLGAILEQLYETSDGLKGMQGEAYGLVAFLGQRQDAAAAANAGTERGMEME